MEGARSQDGDTGNHKQDDDPNNNFAGEILEPVLGIGEDAPRVGNAEQDTCQLDIMCSDDDFKTDDRKRRSNKRPAFNPAPEWANDSRSEDIIAPATRHRSCKTREDHSQEVAGDTCEYCHVGIGRDTECLPFRVKRIESNSPTYCCSYKGGDVEEERVSHTDITHQPRRLPDE